MGTDIEKCLHKINTRLDQWCGQSLDHELDALIKAVREDERRRTLSTVHRVIDTLDSSEK